MSKYSHENGENSKVIRQRELLAVIREEAIGTQSELAERLEGRGVACTQVSISRDIRELEVIKQGGRYVAPGDPYQSTDFMELSKNVSAFIRHVIVVGDNLVVVHTLPGTAHSVGALLDSAHWRELAGTVAGDDTVFAAVLGGEKGLSRLAGRLRTLIKKG